MEKITITVPRVMIAAMHSGSGKTMISCGLLAEYKQRNYHVQAYKCGPDYIDPMFHRTVLGLESGNLDTFFAQPKDIFAIINRDIQALPTEKRLVVMEGVMGYYDGMGGTQLTASSYELSRITKTPVILVVDAKGASVTLAAMLKGMMEFQTDSRIKGVILNRVSPMFYERLKKTIEAACGIPVLGYLPEQKALAVASRHLGLQQPEEIQAQKDWVDAVRQAVGQTVDIDGILAVANTAEALCYEKKEDEILTFPAGYRIGVARDAAFSFYYRENLTLLEAMGATLVPFSPLADAEVPQVDALLFGGGYPELYAKELAENTAMRNSIYALLTQGIPCHAECGGFLYLGKTLEAADGTVYPMVGFLDGHGFRTQRLQRFGYISLSEKQKEDGTMQEAECLHGHEFHYWDSTDCGDAFCAWKPLAAEKTYPCMVRKKGTLAGFPHLYYAGATRFFKALFQGEREKL